MLSLSLSLSLFFFFLMHVHTHTHTHTQGSTEAQRKMRTELMAKLKTQLEEIEQCAQEATASQALPQGSEDETDGAGQGGGGSMSEKQKIIIEELRKRFDMQFGDLDHLRYICLLDVREESSHKIIG